MTTPLPPRGWQAAREFFRSKLFHDPKLDRDQSTRRRRALRPWDMQVLEERVLLSPLAPTIFVSNTNDSGSGSLRQAILDANANTGTDTIAFKIGSGVQRIMPLSALPAITDAVNLFGTSQPGFSDRPLIVIDGTHAGAASNGLQVKSSSCVILGLSISGFKGDGLQLIGGGGSIVLGCNLVNNNGDGLEILGSSNNSIGAAGSANTQTSSRGISAMAW